MLNLVVVCMENPDKWNAELILTLGKFHFFSAFSICLCLQAPTLACIGFFSSPERRIWAVKRFLQQDGLSGALLKG